MRLRLFARSLVGAFCLAPYALAQSVSIDGDSTPAKPATPARPATPAPTPLPPTEPVVPPRARSTPIEYPPQAQGEHEVILELTIDKDGTVTKALAISGEPPFVDVALAASKAWSFEPAKRGDNALSAKIRFAVRFVPPISATEAEPVRAPDVADGEPSALPKAAAEPAMQEILVIGQKEPIKHTLGHADVHDMPGAFGDPYRAIEVLPGVVPIASGLPYFYVRGAPPGNVGYFFDGIPVPYLYHFAAGPGVLQPAFVDRVDLYPGAYPARYGRFAGAIVAGEMAPPTYRFHGEASIRWIDSGVMVEAPFASGRGSAMVGGRFSYTAAVLSLVVPDVSLNYWDYQARIRYELDPKNSLEVLSFGAGDFMSQLETHYRGSADEGNTEAFKEERTLVDVGFHRLDLRLDHKIVDGNWRNALMLGLDRTGADNGSVTVKNRMVGFRSEYRQSLDKTTALRAGGDVLFENLNQQDNSNQNTRVEDGMTITDDSPDNNVRFGLSRARRDLTSGLWADLVLALSPKLEVTPGLRADLFVSGGRVALAIDPRISARYALSKKLTVTHGLALVHQAPSFVVPIPGYKPSLEGGLQTAVQYSAGVSYSLPSGFESSLSVFQNAFFNMTDLIGLIQLQNTTSKDEQDFRTTGHAYGFEAMLRRSLSRRVGGFASYTLSRSLRSAAELEGPATTDRTHVVNLGVSADLGGNWRVGGRWLFYSGIPAQVAYRAAAKSPPRTPPFWRLDFKVQKRWYIKRPDIWWGLVFEVLNTTLNKEVLNGECNALACKFDSVGPVTIPSIGAEGAF
ncbi:MAG TPA: energy transducer TonB [Polyangiaceae bacterium]|nr:energy transducer TonB [Polyangiaceae bacterium]